MLRGWSSRLTLSCHHPPPGPASGRPDDRLRRVIQYSRAVSDRNERPRRTGSPAFAGDDGGESVRPSCPGRGAARSRRCEASSGTMHRRAGTQKVTRSLRKNGGICFRYSALRGSSGRHPRLQICRLHWARRSRDKSSSVLFDRALNVRLPQLNQTPNFIKSILSRAIISHSQPLLRANARFAVNRLNSK